MASAASVALVALGLAWFAHRAWSDREPSATELAARPRPRSEAQPPPRDEALEAMLSELLRNPVESSELVDELERLEAASADSAEVLQLQPQPAPPDAAALVLGDEREPNVARADGLSGALISGEWPDGGAKFEAQQALDEDGAWRLDGAWRAWYPNGQLEELGGYAQGFEHGQWSWWYSSGASMARGAFEDGVRVGAWTFWHPNGVVIGEGAYDDGRRSGRWLFRGADGRVREDFSGEYDFGERVGP